MGAPIEYVPSLKVDLVALPTDLKKEIHESRFKQTSQKSKDQTESTVESTPISSANAKSMTLKSSQNKKTNVHSRNQQVLERMKSLAKIQDLQDNPILGNKLSGGTSIAGNAEESAHDSYLDLVQRRIQAYWKLPPWLARRPLVAQVQLFIDGSGQLRSFKIERSSGSDQFDEAVTHAIEQAQPFSPPPKELTQQLLLNGVLVGFPL